MESDHKKKAEANASGAVKSGSLLRSSLNMRDAIQIFQDINTKANIISINAAIEGARMRGKLSSFSIVAQQIHAQAIKNNELSDKLVELVAKIQTVALRSTAARYYELSEDLIDKLDRNLFERNCDVQAWATFDAIMGCAEPLRNTPSAGVLDAAKNNFAFHTAAGDLMAKLVTTYCVYADVFLLNQQGVVLNAARTRSHIGADWSQKDWFQAALAGNVHVTDMHLCDAINKYAVNYSAPVRNAEGEIIGVLSTRFNWDYAQEMIDHAGYDPEVRAFILNSDSVVIGATDRIGVMRDSMDWLDAGLSSIKGYCGFSIECERNGIPVAVGFAKTKGYNAYRGKKWSALVSTRVAKTIQEHFECRVDLRNDQNPLGTRALEKDVLIESEKANNDLQETMKEIDALVAEVNTNNKEAKLLAINASIQSGIAGSEGEGFAIIAEEIGKLAKKSLGFVESVNQTANELRVVVDDTVNTRLIDAARDSIDKVDRNLFERFCDVQAWTTFREFTDAIETKKAGDSLNTLLAQLHKIYEVYHDIMLVDASGTIIGAGINRRLIGQNQSGRDWFQAAISGSVHFTDVYYSNSIDAPTVAFAAPILGAGGTPIGVLTTRFNCNFLNDILKAVIVDSRSKVYLINQSGKVIASAEPKDILQRSFNHLETYKKLASSKFGNVTEVDTVDKNEYSVSYANTSGYNTYPGKNWSILIRRQTERGEQARRSTEDASAPTSPPNLKLVKSA